MKGITFGTLHSWRDLFLILNSKQIGTPLPKTETIDIPGGNGVLDLTEFFGEVKYHNRKLVFEVSTTVPQSQFMTVFSKVQNALHGQRMSIVLDEEPEWYYSGRITVNEWQANKSIGQFSIEADCEPYKYKQVVTRQPVYLYGKNILDLSNVEQGVLNATVGKSFEELTAFMTETRLRSKMPFLIKPSTQYTFAFPGTTFKAAIRQFDKNNILVASSAWVSSPYTFKTSAKTETLAIYVAFNDDRNIVPSDIAGMEFQVEEGSTATEFEAFQTGNTATITLTNSRMRVNPTIKASGDIVVQFGDISKSLNYTTAVFPEIEFAEGNNTLTVTGSGAVLFAYQEGSL